MSSTAEYLLREIAALIDERLPAVSQDDPHRGSGTDLKREIQVLHEAADAFEDWLKRLPSDSQWRHPFLVAHRELAASLGRRHLRSAECERELAGHAEA